jgi:hypothetical protein
MYQEDKRFLGWVIALILAMIFFIYQMIGCVSVRVQTGEKQSSDREFNGINTTIQKDSIK